MRYDEPWRRDVRWFHELVDETSEVDGSAVAWVPVLDVPQPLVLPRQRRPEDGYRTLRR
jgi:hypothetical protein